MTIDPQEKAFLEQYRRVSTEQPSSDIDSAILKRAATELEQVTKPQQISTWRRLQWPLSLAASAGFIAILFSTNRLNLPQHVNTDPAVAAQQPEMEQQRSLDMLSEEMIASSALTQSETANNGRAELQSEGISALSKSVNQRRERAIDEVIPANSLPSPSATHKADAKERIARLVRQINGEKQAESRFDMAEAASSLRAQKTPDYTKQLFELLLSYYEKYPEEQFDETHLSLLTPVQQAKIRALATPDEPEKP